MNYPPTQSQPQSSHCHTPRNAAQTNPLFPTQSQFHMNNTIHITSSMPSSLLKHTLSPQIPPQPKIQIELNVQRASSTNNSLEWKTNNSQELNYGPQMNNLSIRRHSFVNEYTEFVIKNCSVQTIKSCTKVDQYASSKINRRSSSSNSSNNNNNNCTQLNQLPSSSTIICNNRRKIRTSNHNNSNTNNKTINNLLNGKKLITSTAPSINLTTSAITNNCNSGNNNNNSNNEIISLNSRNMQVLLKRCKSAAATSTTTNNNQFLTQTLTLPGRGIVIKQHNQPDTYVIEDQIEYEDDELEQQKEEVEQNDAAVHLSRTAQILRKFRIPKTTALLPKMVAANNKCLINSDDLSCRSVVSAPTPPPTVGTPNSTSSSVGFLEEVIESVDEDDMQDHTETVIIEESLPKTEILEESDEYLTDENYLTEDGMLSSNTSMSNLDNVSGNTVIMSNNNAGTAAPLQLQTLQPNGAITCINLPPNTILLSAADGTILATAPASNSNNKLHTGEQSSQQQHQQQQQLIALQDWSGNGGNVGMLPQNGTTTMLLTSDGNAIPILQQSMAAAAAANELLKTQVLA